MDAIKMHPPTYLTLKQALGADPARLGDHAAAFRQIAGWVTSYLMNSHPDLGREGDVCPFTAHAARINTIRVAIYDGALSDIRGIILTMRDACRQVRTMPCPGSMRHFTTAIVGFPHARTYDDMETLLAVKRKLKFYTMWRGLMVGQFDEGSEVKGLWNPDFRPMRSPMPLLAIRHLVENDTAFVVQHPLSAPKYLMQFPLAAIKKLPLAWARRKKSEATI